MSISFILFLKFQINLKMAKPSSSSVLLMELVCEVLARLETVNAIVRAELTVNRKRSVEEEISFQDPALERFVDYNDLIAAYRNE